MKSSSGWELRDNPGSNLHRVFVGCHCTTSYFFPLPTAADQAENSYRWRKYTNTPPPVTRLRALDDELLRCKPSGWTVLGFRERTMVTRFGDVVVSRRM